jgi:DNA polymerase I-like protein with 3'-5' exonuclease and polymerase domains
MLALSAFKDNQLFKWMDQNFLWSWMMAYKKSGEVTKMLGLKEKQLGNILFVHTKLKPALKKSHGYYWTEAEIERLRQHCATRGIGAFKVA